MKSDEKNKSPIVIQKRRQARELAFQFLYRHFFLTKDLQERNIEHWSLELKDLGLLHSDESDQSVSDFQLDPFTKELYYSALSNMEIIDKLIEPLLIGWKMERIAKIDHTLLQLGIVEMFFLDEKTPKAVVCNEYVDLSKKYGHKESPAFINGILEKITL